LLPDPILLGGGHENERRAGTENLAGIVGLFEAMERFIKPPVFERSKLALLVSRLTGMIEEIDGALVMGSRKQRLANTVAFVVRGADSITLLIGLDLAGICASSGSACSAGSLEPSHVITALGHRSQASSLVRFSLGRESTLEEVAVVEEVLPEIVRRAQLGK
jgi:cysteine desulfurase